VEKFLNLKISTCCFEDCRETTAIETYITKFKTNATGHIRPFLKQS